MNINFKSFDIWEGVTIENSANQKQCTIKTLELKNSDYQTIRLFEHQEKYYLLISNMVYCCTLEYTIKEISKSLYLQLENLAIHLKDTKSNLYAIECNLVEAIEDNDNIKIEVSQNLKDETFQELREYKRNIDDIINNNSLVV